MARERHRHGTFGLGTKCPFSLECQELRLDSVRHCRRAGVFRNRTMQRIWCKFWRDQEGQDVAEYAMMLIIILLLAGVSVKMVGANVRQVFAKTTMVTDSTQHRGSVRDGILHHCEEAVRQQLDASMRADFPVVTPELSVHRVDDNDFAVESFVETRTADGSLSRIDYSCHARCSGQDACSVVAEVRK